MSTLSKVSTLTTLECGSCHIPFAIPTSMHEDAVRTGWAETARQAARDQAALYVTAAQCERVRALLVGAGLADAVPALGIEAPS